MRMDDAVARAYRIRRRAAQRMQVMLFKYMLAYEPGGIRMATKRADTAEVCAAWVSV